MIGAAAAGLALARLLIDPSARDMRALALCLVLSGAGTIALGWVAFVVTDRATRLSIETKVFLGAVIGSAVALLNVTLTAALMLLSTSHDLRLLVTLLVFSAIVTAYFSLRVASAITSRVTAVSDVIAALAAGTYAVRLPAEGTDQLATLAANVNQLAQQLEAMERQRAELDAERRELTAAVSHDLRTPLASVRAMVEALDDGVVEEPVEVQRYYASIRREIERLSRTIDDLFELAQLDAGSLRLSREPVTLQEIAAEVVDAMQEQARRGRVALALRLTVEPSATALDGGRIERAIANLVRNALEHTPAGGRVEVVVGGDDRWMRLDVTDSGDGIDEADLPHIWDRFYRGERSRRRGPRGDDGAGLGLAIVRGVVEAHGGTVAVRSTPDRGSMFTIRLPSSVTRTEEGFQRG